ncbi:MAG: IS630 family transposase [Candidatus Eisenbacteria bacterium]
MAAELRVGRPTLRWLARVDRQTHDADVRIRCRVLLKVARGESRSAAAHALGCAPSTACRIVARFQVLGEGAVFDGRSENGTRKVDADVEAQIRSILTKTPQEHGFPRPTWTLELLARVIAEVLDVELSVGHLWKVLSRLRVRWGRPRPVVACPWKAARRKARIAFLRRLAAQSCSREVLVFVDEVDLHLNPKIGPDWMLPGTQRLIMTPGKNEKRYLAGAYDHREQRLVYVEGDRKASWLFLNLLRALNEAYPEMRTIHVILDNYIIHKSKIVLAWLAAHGARIELHFLPPYCPEENRIERLWLDLHANVTRNHRCRTIVELMAAVHAYLARRFDLIAVHARAA